MSNIQDVNEARSCVAASELSPGTKSVGAPAGSNSDLRRRGLSRVSVCYMSTVVPGTFRPVIEAQVDEARRETERGAMDRSTLGLSGDVR